MRCLPASKVPLAQGRCLHDWHAEVVALRAFNHFLIQECALLLRGGRDSSRIVQSEDSAESHEGVGQKFSIRNDVRIHMYCSEAPCGDASMELTINSQQDATPWAVPGSAALLNGRGHFSELGIVRRKPARSDAPLTLSKSCSDKLALKQCTSILSSLANLLFSPKNAYLHQLVLPASQHVREATTRSFGSRGRMSSLVADDARVQRHWPGDFAFRPFRISTTTVEFAYSRRTASFETPRKGSNIAAVWTPHLQEVLIGGSVQGHKQMSLRGASAISRLRMWQVVLRVAEAAAMPLLVAALQQPNYAQIKSLSELEGRRRVKQKVTAAALQNWIQNERDEDFAIEQW